MTAKWVIERGSIEAPEMLRLTPNDGDHWHAWVEDEDRASRFETEEAALEVATETGADALRITELDDVE